MTKNLEYLWQTYRYDLAHPFEALERPNLHRGPEERQRILQLLSQQKTARDGFRSAIIWLESQTEINGLSPRQRSRLLDKNLRRLLPAQTESIIAGESRPVYYQIGDSGLLRIRRVDQLGQLDGTMHFKMLFGYDGGINHPALQGLLARLRKMKLSMSEIQQMAIKDALGTLVCQIAGAWNRQEDELIAGLGWIDQLRSVICPDPQNKVSYGTLMADFLSGKHVDPKELSDEFGLRTLLDRWS